MSHDRTPPDEGNRTRAEIEVEIAPARGRFAARVALHGEHDIATSGAIREALSPIFGNVLVDLSDCSFIDSSVISVLLADCRERRREGQSLEVLVPPWNVSITRTIQVSGVASILTVRDGDPG
jgi:anti-anti-sigma factor